MVKATLARREIAGIQIGDDIELGKIYEVDLDSVQVRPALDLNTNSHIMLKTITTADGGWLPIELLDFDAEAQKILDDQEWPEELPPDADRPRPAAFDPFGGDPFMKLLGPMIESFSSSMSGMMNKVTRPKRVKLLSALTVEGLEAEINDFLSSPTGANVCMVSDRIIRYGNELVKEIHYHIEADTEKAIEVEIKAETSTIAENADAGSDSEDSVPSVAKTEEEK